MDFVTATQSAFAQRRTGRRLKLSAAGLALCAAGLMGLSAGAHADEQYKRDVAACNSGHTSEAKATCLREAGAAQVERQRNGLSDVGSSKEARNAEQRCNALPGNQRQDCMYLMSGQGQTTVQGSVAGGGVLRETVIQVPAGSSAPAYAPGGSAPMAPPPAMPPSTTPYGSSPRY